MQKQKKMYHTTKRAAHITYTALCLIIYLICINYYLAFMDCPM